MSSKTISLTEALLLKKRYAARISTLLEALEKENRRSNVTSVFSTIVKGSNKEKDIYGRDIEDLKKECRSSLQSFESLVNNYKVLCRAINLANATTYVDIDKDKYTISELIALKGSGVVKLYEDMSSIIFKELTAASTEVIKQNNTAVTQERLLEYIKAVVPENSSQDDIDSATKKFNEQFSNSIVYCIPEIQELAIEYRDKSDNFRDLIDLKLAEINSRTEITVDFED